MAPEFFLNPTDPMQRRYEALRASFVEGLSAHEVATKFGYSVPDPVTTYRVALSVDSNQTC